MSDGINLTWEDEEWFQAIDYEHIPIHCRRCHEHGNLFRDYLQNKRPGGKKDQELQDAEGFTKIQNKKRQARNISGPKVHKRVQTQNRFETLQEDQTKDIADAQIDSMTDKIQGKQQEEKDNDTQGIGKIISPKDNLGTNKTNPDPLPQSRPEETQKDSGSVEVVLRTWK